jgi:hypothetical protein
VSTLLPQVSLSPSAIRPFGDAVSSNAVNVTSRQRGMAASAVALPWRDKPVPRYLLQRRVAHARQLLEITDLPVNRIAARRDAGCPALQQAIPPSHRAESFRRTLGAFR